jgi:uncharacterized protein (TIGR03118 family)
MSILRSVSKWFRGHRQRRATPARQPTRPRLALEALEDRNLMSANFLQTNLVSDLPGLARLVDPTLHNPWGISLSPNGGAFWVSSNGGGVSELYLGDLNGTPLSQPFQVTIPTPSIPPPIGSPTGQVFNPNQPIMSNGNSTDFSVTDGTNTAAAVFLFATREGAIVGWNPGVGAPIQTPFGMLSGTGEIGFGADDGAIYDGLAIGDFNGAHFLYAADFHNGKIDVIDGQFNQVTLGTNGFGTFTDPNLPRGFAPFNIQNLGGKLYVTYAQQNATGTRDVAGPGNGFIDVFDTSGHFLQRLVSNGALNSPWGLALAPSNFGSFSNDLLVGNFGDGTISAYNPTTGAFVGQMLDEDGNAIHIDGLWGLQFGNGVSSGSPNTLFFSAGINSGRDGLFGSLQPTVAGGANARFVDQVYQDLLNRQADPAGLAAWTGALDGGMTRAQVVAGIESSTEFLTAEVQKAYQQFLHRPADAAGLTAWVNFLQQGHTVEQMEAGIIGSPEYLQSRGGGTNNGFLTAVIQDVLNRAVTAADQGTFGTALANGASTGQVAASILSSQEGLQAIVQGLYGSLLHRPADNAGLTAFVNAMQQGLTDQQVIAALAGSDEFFANL